MLLLNPKYKHLQSHFEHIRELIAGGTLIHAGRNHLYAIEIDGIKMCIKEYRKPRFLNQFIYRFFRKSKGLRAWLHSDILRQTGFDSPENIAYIQSSSLWGIGICYYICLYQEGRTLYHWGNKALSEIQTDVTAFAQLTARLHQAGIMLCDYTPGNILQTEKGFAFVDTNRMYQGEVSIKKGLRNMAGLWLQPDVADYLTSQYIKARGIDCTPIHVSLMRRYRKVFWKKFARKHAITTEKVHTDLDGNSYYFNIQSTIQ